MKDSAVRIARLMMLLTALVLAFVSHGCYVCSETRGPRSLLIERIGTSTVALVSEGEDGTSAYCGGVWINDTTIITAAHCARARLESAFNVDRGDNPVIDALIDDAIIGFHVPYVVKDDVRTLIIDPVAVHDARIAKIDNEKDLAVLIVEDAPMHTYASIAHFPPSVGETLHVMGHTIGLYWTYSQVIVSAVRCERYVPIPIIGPFVQVAGEVYSGNSGGGAFNEDGELVGIASFITRAPGTTFFVSAQSIRTFLKE